MKQHILITLAAISLCLTGCSKKDDKDPSFMFWNFRKEVVSGFYHVPDMNSEEIATYLRDRVKTIRGYVDSSADLSSNTLTVNYRSSQVRKMNFEEAIALAGFSVNGRPADPKAKLPVGLKTK